MNKKFFGAIVCILIILLAALPTNADNPKGRDSQKLGDKQHVQQLVKEAFEYAEKEVLPLEGIEGVSYTEEPARIIVYIESEEYRATVPDKIKGIKTEIRISGKIYALGTPLAEEMLSDEKTGADEDTASSDTVELTKEQLNMVYDSVEQIKEQNPMDYIIVMKMLEEAITSTDDGGAVVDMDMLKKEMQNYEIMMPGHQLPKKGTLGGIRHSRVRPLVGGTSCSLPFLLQWVSTYGTLGIVTGQSYLLSCAHVIAMNRWGIFLFPGIPVIQPGSYDGGKWQSDDFAGRLTKFTRIKWIGANYADAAIAYVPWWAGYKAEEVLAEDDTSTYHIDMNTYTVPNVGQIVIKSGATSGVTENDITDTHATITVRYTPLKTATFKDVIIVDQPFIEGGDSGSVVAWDQYGSGNIYWVGLGFAGSYAYAYVCKAEHIFDELGIFV